MTKATKYLIQVPSYWIFCSLTPDRPLEVNPLHPFSYVPLPSLSLAGWPSDPIPLYLQGLSGYHSPHLALCAERGIWGRAAAPPSFHKVFLGG